MSLSEKVEEIIAEEKRARRNAGISAGLGLISAGLAIYSFSLERHIITDITFVGSVFLALKERGMYHNFRDYANWLRESYPAYFSRNNNME